MMGQELKEYVHEESFDHLASGEEIAIELLDERNKIESLVSQALDIFTQINEVAKRPCPIGGVSSEYLVHELINGINYTASNFTIYKKAIMRDIDAKYWKKLLKASRVSTLMNKKQKDKLLIETSSENAPEFNIESVIGTIQDQHLKRFETFVSAAVDVFNSISSSFKSNDKIKLREKIIFSGAFNGRSWNHHSHSRDYVQDLERVFMVLDGKDPELLDTNYRNPETAENRQNVSIRIEDTFKAGTHSAEFEYFNVKMFQNGNLHVIFNREDLVEKFNNMLASFKRTKSWAS